LGRSLDYIFVSSRDIDVVDEGLSVSHFSDHKALLGRVAER
jgi:endonuclease/exonuclease/phosphatase (EEP) superfamily protein YafD